MRAAMNGQLPITDYSLTAKTQLGRSFNPLVKHHGEDAPIEAAMGADAMLEASGLDG